MSIAYQKYAFASCRIGNSVSKNTNLINKDIIPIIDKRDNWIISTKILILSSNLVN